MVEHSLILLLSIALITVIISFCTFRYNLKKNDPKVKKDALLLTEYIDYCGRKLSNIISQIEVIKGADVLSDVKANIKSDIDSVIKSSIVESDDLIKKYIDKTLYKKALKSILPHPGWKAEFRQASSEAMSKLVDKDNLQKKLNDVILKNLELLQDNLSPQVAEDSYADLCLKKAVDEKIKNDPDFLGRHFGNKIDISNTLQGISDGFIVGGAMAFTGIFVQEVVKNFGAHVLLDEAIGFIHSTIMGHITTELVHWIAQEVGENALNEFLEHAAAFLTGIGALVLIWKARRYYNLYKKLSGNDEIIEEWQLSVKKAVSDNLKQFADEANQKAIGMAQEMYETEMIKLENMDQNCKKTQQQMLVAQKMLSLSI